MLLVLIITIIGGLLWVISSTCLPARGLLQAHQLELLWTVIPGVVLLGLAAPSIQLLYCLDEAESPTTRIKIIGHQWYWEYEYFTGSAVDRYMGLYEGQSPGELVKIEVDTRLVLPYGTIIRAIVRRADVIHSWAIPSLGVKRDAIPGRLNALSVDAWGPAVVYGQCSEICGANHSFIPITVEFIGWSEFILYLKTLNSN